MLMLGVPSDLYAAAERTGLWGSAAQQAVKWYVDGMNFRRIAYQVGVSHQTVINWVNAAVAQLPPAPLAEQVEVGEMDKVHSFMGREKTKSFSRPS